MNPAVAALWFCIGTYAPGVLPEAGPRYIGPVEQAARALRDVEEGRRGCCIVAPAVAPAREPVSVPAPPLGFKCRGARDVMVFC